MLRLAMEPLTQFDFNTCHMAGVLGGRIAFAGQSAGMLQESAMFVDDFLAFARLAPPVTAPRECAGQPAGRAERATIGKVAAQDVTFSYPCSPRIALHDVTLHIEPGDVVALVGANGSGKTTLAKLLAGPYLPTSGTITWDGTDTRDVDSRELLSRTAIVFQDFIRYNLSAADNIALGRHERASDTEAIIAAAVQAGGDADISGLPEGYQTLLGPAFIDGKDLSLGQWQRLAIARTFFRDAPRDPRRTDRSAGRQGRARAVQQDRRALRRPFSAADLPPVLHGALSRPDLRPARGDRRGVGNPRAANGPGRCLRGTVHPAGISLPAPLLHQRGAQHLKAKPRQQELEDLHPLA